MGPQIKAARKASHGGARGLAVLTVPHRSVEFRMGFVPYARLSAERIVGAGLSEDEAAVVMHCVGTCLLTDHIPVLILDRFDGFAWAFTLQRCYG